MTNSENKILNYTPTEIISVLSIIGVGYTLLYKFSYFYNLGIPWYLTNISPFSIINSSLMFICLSIPGIMIGIRLATITSNFDQKYDTYWFSTVSMLFLLILIISSIPNLIFSSSNAHLDLYSLNLIFLMVMSGMLSMINIKEYFISGFRHTNQNPIFIITPIVISFVCIAFIYGAYEADKAINNKSKYLSEVVIDKDQDKWFLVDLMGDKALVVKDDKERIFKIVEYKEIKQFKIQI